jgi:hypothetical protein
VKLLSADDSVGLPHVKVGHCQAFNINLQHLLVLEVFFAVNSSLMRRVASRQMDLLASLQQNVQFGLLVCAAIVEALIKT